MGKKTFMSSAHSKEGSVTGEFDKHASLGNRWGGEVPQLKRQGRIGARGRELPGRGRPKDGGIKPPKKIAGSAKN